MVSKKKFLSLATFLFAGMLLYHQPHLAQAADPDEPLPVGDVGYCAVRTMVTPEGCGLTIRSNCGGSFYPSSVGGAEAACRAAIASQVSPPASATPSPAEFVPLTGLPGLTDNQSRGLADYLNILFRLSIGLGALAGVIKITLAGIKYMSSDAFSSKEEAKKDITGALLGLLIMLSTVVILQFIYPGILNLNVLQQLPPIVAVDPQAQSPAQSMLNRLPKATPEQERSAEPRSGERVIDSKILTMSTAALGGLGGSSPTPEAAKANEIVELYTEHCIRKLKGTFTRYNEHWPSGRVYGGALKAIHMFCTGKPSS